MTRALMVNERNGYYHNVILSDDGEDWDEVQACFPNPPEPMGDLLGWGPYTKVYRLVADDEWGTVYTYFVAE